MVERVSGLSLHDYCTEFIFQPLGIENMSFFPPKEMKDKLARMHQRSPDGKLKERSHLLLRPLKDQSMEEVKSTLNSAGAGLFAQPKEYVKIISTLLNDGTSPNTGKQILKPETVNEMFKNQIPEMPNFGRQGIDASIPELTNPIRELYPQPQEQEQGWGLTFMLTLYEGATGRGRNTGWWAGLPNLFWWADREKGVGGMVASQILPFGDAAVMGLWAECEGMVYRG
jgi:CubicO group peptidase (beta-lactamase class C family)